MDTCFRPLCINTKGCNCRITRECFNFLKIAQLSSKVTVPFCMPMSTEWEFSMLFIPVNIWWHQYSSFGHCHRCIVVSHCFSLPFPDNIFCGDIFICLFVICISLVKSLFSHLAHALIGLFVFLSLSFISYFGILWIIVVYHMCISHIFSISLRLIFRFFWQCVL